MDYIKRIGTGLDGCWEPKKPNVVTSVRVTFRLHLLVFVTELPLRSHSKGNIVDHNKVFMKEGRVGGGC